MGSYIEPLVVPALRQFGQESTMALPNALLAVWSLMTATSLTGSMPPTAASMQTTSIAAQILGRHGPTSLELARVDYPTCRSGVSLFILATPTCSTLAQKLASSLLRMVAPVGTFLKTVRQTFPL